MMVGSDSRPRPGSLAESHDAPRQAVVARGEILVGYSHVVPQADDPAEAVAVVATGASDLMEKEPCGHKQRVEEVEIAHGGVNVPDRSRVLRLVVCGVSPELPDGEAVGGESRIPYHRGASVTPDEILRPLHESLLIMYAHFVGADMQPGTERGRDLPAEFADALLQDPAPLLAVHRLAESGHKIVAVARNIDLGHDHDAAGPGIGYYVAYLVVGVKAPLVASGPLEFPVVEPRISLALYAPGWTVGEVPLKHVELIGAHKVEIALYAVDAREIASVVVHEASYRKFGPVGDPHKRIGAVGSAQLSECLPRPDRTRAVGGLYRDSVAAYGQQISFGMPVQRSEEWVDCHMGDCVGWPHGRFCRQPD